MDFQEETHPEKDTDKRVFSQDRQLFTDSKSSFSILRFKNNILKIKMLNFSQNKQRFLILSEIFVSSCYNSFNKIKSVCSSSPIKTNVDYNNGSQSFYKMPAPHHCVPRHLATVLLPNSRAFSSASSNNCVPSFFPLNAGKIYNRSTSSFSGPIGSVCAVSRFNFM